MASFDPYAILGVSKTATEDEIKSAYRKLAKKLHPDLNPGKKDIENRFKEVNRAYELVGTPEARTKFDRGETQEQKEEAFRNRRSRGSAEGGPFYYYETQGEPGGGRYSSSFEGFDPGIFEDLFGRRAGRHGSRSSRGEDQQYSMEVDFNTSVLGGEREITLPSGSRLRVKIPAGIKEGQKLRLAGKAEAVHGQTPGDVYVEIKVSPSPLFRRVGDDIEIDLPLNVQESVLGAEVRVPTVDGFVELKIPKHVSTGTKIRIKGKGVPKGSHRGDQFAVVKIVMPPKGDKALEEFMGQWHPEHSFNPRSGWEQK